MDKNDIERRLEAAEKQNLGLLDEIKYLKAQLAKVQDEPEIPDFPEFKYMDIVYKLDSCLDVVQEEHGGGTGDKDFTGDGALFYNDFHTADYANEFRRKCLIIAMMLHCKWYLDRDYVPDWNDTDSRKFYAMYDHYQDEYISGCSCHYDQNNVYFSTEENAQKAADWLNEHWKEDGNGTD